MRSASIVALVLAAWLWINMRATRRVLRSDEDGFRKKLFVAGIWIVPFFGALAVRNVGAAAPQGHDVRSPAAAAPPATLQLAHGEPFDVPAHLVHENGVPLLDWDALHAWSAQQANPAAATALGRRAWLLHLGAWLGPQFHLQESADAWLLSSLDRRSEQVLLDYVATTRKRVQRLLDGVAHFPANEKSLIVIFDDEETYYHYVATYYPDDGEFAFSGGMFISFGCPHFVARRADLAALEPTIAHELTHSALAHLELPLWLDEGIAVNTEQRLTRTRLGEFTPQELHAKHLQFWNAETIQQFWSGASFQRTDDGNLLSYDLARILVEKMSGNWKQFAAFVNAASRLDAGAAAAREHLDVDMGHWVAALFQPPEREGWAPAIETPAGLGSRPPRIGTAQACPLRTIPAIGESENEEGKHADSETPP